MTRALLDINVLIALLDSDHVDHRRVHAWADEGLQGGWATCPITENGFVRIISQPRYPSPVPPAKAIELLRGACEGGTHELWPCDISLLDDQTVERTRLHGPRQVTDTYLLALATAHGGHFVTFDRSVSSASVPGAGTLNLTVL